MSGRKEDPKEKKPPQCSASELILILFIPKRYSLIIIIIIAKGNPILLWLWCTLESSIIVMYSGATELKRHLIIYYYWFKEKPYTILFFFKHFRFLSSSVEEKPYIIIYGFVNTIASLPSTSFTSSSSSSIFSRPRDSTMLLGSVIEYETYCLPLFMYFRFIIRILISVLALRQHIKPSLIRVEIFLYFE